MILLLPLLLLSCSSQKAQWCKSAKGADDEQERGGAAVGRERAGGQLRRVQYKYTSFHFAKGVALIKSGKNPDTRLPEPALRTLHLATISQSRKGKEREEKRERSEEIMSSANGAPPQHGRAAITQELATLLPQALQLVLHCELILAGSTFVALIR